MSDLFVALHSLEGCTLPGRVEVDEFLIEIRKKESVATPSHSLLLSTIWAPFFFPDPALLPSCPHNLGGEGMGESLGIFASLKF